MRKRSRMLAQGAVAAALYVAISYLQNLIIPGSASYVIQFRAAEALCVLALFTPAVIPGLAVGCMLFNLNFAGALPLDVLIGPIATLIAVAGMYYTRHLTIRGYPLLAMLLPAIANSLLIGWELSLYMGGSFWLNAGYVAIGEAAVLLTLGTGLYWAIKARHLDRHIFPQ